MSDVGATTRTLTGSGPLFHEALHALADLIEERCPAAVPAGPRTHVIVNPVPLVNVHSLHAWAEGGQWHVRAEVEPL